MPRGHGFVYGDDLERELASRGVSQQEADHAADVLSGPDPGGVIPHYAVSRDEVANVAAYMHVVQGRFVNADPVWYAIAGGHPAARALYWHEYQELMAYGTLGVRAPLYVIRPGPGYWRAHAKACWEEAGYWEAWARALGTEISAAAFLFANPLREDDLPDVLGLLLSTWSVALPACTLVELDRGRAFYRQMRLSREGIRQWL